MCPSLTAQTCKLLPVASGGRSSVMLTLAAPALPPLPPPPPPPVGQEMRLSANISSLDLSPARMKKPSACGFGNRGAWMRAGFQCGLCRVSVSCSGVVPGSDVTPSSSCGRAVVQTQTNCVR